MSPSQLSARQRSFEASPVAGRREDALANLRLRICSVLDTLIPPRSEVALIDFPNHANVGDSAIFLGELVYLRQRGCRQRYVCDWQTYDARALSRALGAGIILIHGGGNFGDLYPQHQKLRETVIRDFPSHRIVQLPQSIHFDDPQGWERLRVPLTAHSDFHLVVRDKVSFALAQQGYDGPVHLCPDMALMLKLAPARAEQAHCDALLLSRTDGEKVGEDVSNSSNEATVEICDWLDEPQPRDAWLYQWASERARWPSTRWPQYVLAWALATASRRMATQRLERGLGLLHRGRVLATDRLHALLLAWMTCQPVFHADNRYRKLGNLLDTWLPARTELQAYPSLDAALSAALASSRNAAGH